MAKITSGAEANNGYSVTRNTPHALPANRGGEGPAVLVLPIAFDPAEEIPPYSERPEEIRARFRL